MNPLEQLGETLQVFRTGIVIFLGLGALYLLYRLLHGITHPFRNTKNWTDRTGRKVTFIILSIIFLLLASTAIVEFVEPALLPLVPDFLLGYAADVPPAILVGLIFFQLKRLLSAILADGEDGLLVDANVNLQPFRTLANGIVGVIGGALILQTLGMDLGGLVLAGGFVVAIVSLASQDTAANAVNFIVLLANKRVFPGKRITVFPDDVITDGVGAYGVVADMGFFNVILKTDDKKEISIPNNRFSRAVVLVHDPDDNDADTAKDPTDGKTKAQRLR